jgi:hypothetical protein
LFDQKNNN